MRFFDKIPWWVFLGLSLTLGLAPFFPEPHIWQKLKMLYDGTLVKPLDIFDLFDHSLPWLLLLLKWQRMGLEQG